MKENGFEYVDLGLPSGTMWATCNIGADKPEDSGLLFHFGRVDGYRYGDENNKFRTIDQNKEDTGHEYIPITTSGKVYKEGDILCPEDDAAHVYMGGKWRMATNDELEELYNNTTHRTETLNGVNCMLFTSKKNGKRLFIPFAGYWYNGSFNALGSNAFVWSSQVRSSNVNTAYILYCSSSGTATVHVNDRTFAFSVRGVFVMNKKDNDHKFEIKLDDAPVITINLYFENDVSKIYIDTKINTKGLYNLYERLRNDILLNNLNKDYILDWIEKIENYNKWLKEIYIPKFGNIDNFYNQVYLWVKEDLSNFALYCDLKLNF